MSIFASMGHAARNEGNQVDLLSAELASLRARDEILIASISALMDGRYDAVDRNDKDPVSSALSRLATKLATSASSNLDRVVDLDIQSNETAISAARMLMASREVDDRVQGLASASQEMVASIGQIGSTADDAARYAAEMRKSAEAGMATVGSASAAMTRVGKTANEASDKIKELSEASDAIGTIVSSIDAIAKQTNLLALNATIEAARAGEAGRGFAVVASEVKALSQQTSRATDDIRDRIERLRAEIETIVAAMADCTTAAIESETVVARLGEAMSGVGSHIATVTNDMNEIANILGQQTSASREIAEGLSTIAAKTRQNVEQIKGISSQLDLAQDSVGQQLQELSKLSFDNKVPRLAKADHVIWKKRLADMAVGRVTLKADELADHHSCRLGKWYYGDGSRDLKNHASFLALEKPHALVHQHGKQAARLFEKGDLAGALAEIELVETSSKEVLRLLDDLGR